MIKKKTTKGDPSPIENKGLKVKTHLKEIYRKKEKRKGILRGVWGGTIPIQGPRLHNREIRWKD